MHPDPSLLHMPAFLSPYLSQHLFDQGLAFLQVVFIDIVMAGDNAVAVGLAAAGLAPDKRRRAILFGLIGAVVTRIGFVLITVQLFQIIGLLLAGGLLLLWVCWKMWRDLRRAGADAEAHVRQPKTLWAAVVQILIADIYTLRGDADQVFAWLDRGIAKRDPGVAAMYEDPFLVPALRQDPRLALVARRLGLPDPATVPARWPMTGPSPPVAPHAMEPPATVSGATP